MSAIHDVLGVHPSDDAGAQTADLFDWQAAMAAAEGLAAYLQHLQLRKKDGGDVDIRFICEIHEDWIVQAGSTAELVSAKHREAASGAWRTVTVLVNDGGIGHLFVRWLQLGQTAAVRLVTSAAAATGEAANLAACPLLIHRSRSGQDLTVDEKALLKDGIDKLARSLMMYRKGLPPAWQAPERARATKLIINDELRAAVTEFLAVLSIDQSRPNREFVGHAAPSLYAQPLTREIGCSEHLASAIWHAVLQLFRARMRARGPSKRGGLPVVGVGPADRTADADASDLESRTITMRDIEIAIKVALDHPVAFLPLTSAPRVTKLGVKMSAGGCSETSIERAERLRLDYLRYRRERRDSVPGSSAEQRPLERKLHRVADDETASVRTAEGDWGGAYWASLSKRFEHPPNSLVETGLDAELLLGGVCDLVARCQVWFSPKFDVDAAIAQAKASPTGGAVL